MIRGGFLVSADVSYRDDYLGNGLLVWMNSWGNVRRE
jgi:hypothetical protein